MVEDIGDSVAPVDGRDITLSIDSKVQFFAYQRVRDAVAAAQGQGRQRGRARRADRRGAGAGQLPELRPGDRSNLTGAQLRNRALTDTFEPGSTMKPFIVALALETGRVKPTTVIQTAPGPADDRRRDHQRLAPARRADGGGGDPEVEQRRHGQDGDADAAARDAGAVRPRRLRPEAAARLPRRGDRPAAPVQDLAADRAGDDELRLRPVGQPVPAGARLHGVRPRRRADAGDAAEAPGCRRRDAGQAARAVAARPRATCARCCSWPPARAAPRRRRRPWAIRSAARPAPRTSRKARATRPKKYRSWFVGMAPINDPRIIVAVMVDEPTNGKYFGGDVAAPVFSEVVQQTLRTLDVAPDLDVRAADRHAPDAGRRGELLMPLLRIDGIAAALSWLRSRGVRGAVRRQPAPAARRRLHRLAGPCARRARSCRRRAGGRRAGLPGRGRRRRGLRLRRPAAVAAWPA